MTKQDYFVCRLLHDGYRFLSSNHRGTSKRLIFEVSTMLESLLYDGAKSIFANCNRRIDSLLDANFGNQSDMVGWQRLPKSFVWIDVCNAIVRDYNAELDKLFNKLDMSKKIVSLMQPRVECWVWTDGIEPTANMLANMPKVINRMVQSYRPDHLDDYPLKKEIGYMFVDAKRVTLREWLNKSNDADIVKLKDGMSQYTRCLLNASLYRHMYQLGGVLSKLPIWTTLSEKLFDAASQLRERQRPIPSNPDHPEWESEYAHLDPVDFYFRNVESISASGAFHLLVLQAYSRNENNLIKLGYLKPLTVYGTEPEIRIFSNIDTNYPEAFDTVEETLKTLL